MYAKAIQTTTNWVIAYENPITETFIISYAYVGTVPQETNEEYETLEELEISMTEIAPISEWSEELYSEIVS